MDPHAALSLAAFVWLLSLHPTAAGRTYAAYGSVYVAVALVWLWAGVRPDRWDGLGGSLALIAAIRKTNSGEVCEPERD